MTLLFLILRRAVVLCTFMQETETWEGSLPKNIEAFQHADTIIVNAAGCGCMLKEYPELFREEEQEWLEKAEVFAKSPGYFKIPSRYGISPSAGEAAYAHYVSRRLSFSSWSRS